MLIKKFICLFISLLILYFNLLQPNQQDDVKDEVCDAEKINKSNR